MKRHVASLLLIFLLCFSICGYSLAQDSEPASASTKQANGNCYISHAGKSVTYSGYSSSAQTEDTISVKVKLMEKQSDGTWKQVGSSAYKSEDNDTYVSTAKTYSVAGGHYYKVVATHYSIKNGTSHTTQSSTSSVWIGA